MKYQMKHPNVLDIKLGTIVYEKTTDSRTMKKGRERAMYSGATDYGMVMQGFQVRIVTCSMNARISMFSIHRSTTTLKRLKIDRILPMTGDNPVLCHLDQGFL